METYYRRGVFRHFSEDCKCSVSVTSRIDVTALRAYSKRTDTRFYINFLYVLSRALNAREDYRLMWDWQNERLLCWDQINPTQYVFHADTETFTIRIMRYFMRVRLPIWKRRSRRAITGWTVPIIRTGLMRHAYRGSAMSRCMSSCRTGICISARSSTGAHMRKKTADTKCL